MIRYSNHTQKRKLIFSYMNKLREKHARYNFFKKSISDSYYVLVLPIKTQIIIVGHNGS